MSYARWSPSSDVYVYRSVHGPIVCCGCYFETSLVDELEQHLREHERDGDLVDVEDIMAQARAEFPTGVAGVPDAD